MTATGMITVACTMIAETQFGRTCCRMIRAPPASSVFALVTKSALVIRSVSPRTMRIIAGTCEMPMATTAFVRLGPLIAASPTAMMRNGKASATSVRRLMIASSQRQYPASSPSGVPTTTASRTDRTPTTSETWMPYSVRDRMSRPRSSVPRPKPTVNGTWNGRSKCVVVGSYGATSGAVTPARTTTASMMPPVMPRRFVRTCFQTRPRLDPRSNGAVMVVMRCPPRGSSG